MKILFSYLFTCKCALNLVTLSCPLINDWITKYMIMFKFLYIYLLRIYIYFYIYIYKYIYYDELDII